MRYGTCKRKPYFLFLCMLFMAGAFLLSCNYDDSFDSDNNAQENADDNAEENENQDQNDDVIIEYDLADFYDSIPNITYHMDSVISDYVLIGYDNFVAAIPPGIYLFSNVAGKQKIIAIGTDHSVMSFNPASLEKTTGYEGDNLKCDCYGDDGKNSGFLFYNDRFGAANDYSPAPTVCEYEFGKREDLMLVYKNYPFLLWYLTKEMLSCFSPSRLDLDDFDGYKSHYGGKTTIKGVECNYYYVTKVNEDLQTDNENLPVKYQELWVTDSFVCLQQVDSLKDTICTMSGFWPSGTFAENYEKITELFSVYGKTKISEALHCHKKYGNCWLSDEYPELINKWLPLYEGNVKTFSVTRRAMMGLDNITNIKVEITGASQDKVRKYIATLKELNKFTSYRSNDKGSFITFMVDDPNGTKVSVDGVSLYPVLNLSFYDSTFDIIIDFIRL